MKRIQKNKPYQPPELKQAYYGMPAIARRMGCGTRRLITLINDYAFPISTHFYRNGRWSYVAYEERIQLWYQVQEDLTRRHLLTRPYLNTEYHKHPATGRKLVRKRPLDYYSTRHLRAEVKRRLSDHKS